MANYLKNPQNSPLQFAERAEATKTYYSKITVTTPERRYDEAQECIYCGNSTGKRSLEHIVPLSLGGTLLFPSASCAVCAKITGRFEQRVARYGLWPIRDRLNFPSRSKSPRPTNFNLQLTLDDDSVHVIPINAAQYPAMFFIQLFEKCRFLQGIIDSENPDEISNDFLEFMGGPDSNYLMRVAQPGIDAIEKQTGRKAKMISNAAMPPFALAQLVAKIAHGYATAEFGIGAFEPLLCGFITDKEEIFSRYVGGSFTRPPFSKNLLHRLSIEPILFEGEWYLKAHFNLFAIFCGGYYHAIVGRLEGPTGDVNEWKASLTRTTDIEVDLLWTGEGPDWLKNGPRVRMGGQNIWI